MAVKRKAAPKKRTTTKKAPHATRASMKKYDVRCRHGSSREHLEVTARTAASARKQAKEYLDKHYEPAAWNITCKIIQP